MATRTKLSYSLEQRQPTKEELERLLRENAALSLLSDIESKAQKPQDEEESEQSSHETAAAVGSEAKQKFASGLRAVLPTSEHILVERPEPEDAMAKNFDYLDVVDPAHAEILHESDHSVYDIKHGIVGQASGDIRYPSETGNRLVEDIQTPDVDDRVRSRVEPIDGIQPMTDSFNALKSYDSLTGKPQEDDNLMSRQGYSIGDGTPEEAAKFEAEGGLVGRDDYSLTEGYASDASRRLSEAQADKQYSLADGSVADRQQRGYYDLMNGYQRPKNNLTGINAQLARQQAKLEQRKKEILLMQTKDAVRVAEDTVQLLKNARKNTHALRRKTPKNA